MKKNKSTVAQGNGGVTFMAPTVIKTMSGSTVSLVAQREGKFFALMCDCASDGDAQAICEALKRSLKDL